MVDKGVDAKTMAAGAVLTTRDFRGLAVRAAFMACTFTADGPEFVGLQRHLKGRRFASALAAGGLRRPRPLQGQRDEQQDGERPFHDGKARGNQQPGRGQVRRGDCARSLPPPID